MVCADIILNLYNKLQQAQKMLGNSEHFQMGETYFAKYLAANLLMEEVLYFVNIILGFHDLEWAGNL